MVSPAPPRAEGAKKHNGANGGANESIGSGLALTHSQQMFTPLDILAVTRHDNPQLGRGATEVWVAVGLSVLATAVPAWAGEIYSSLDGNGQTRWATQPLDSSYSAIPALRTVDGVPIATLLPPALGGTALQAQLAQRRRSVLPLVQAAAQRHGVSAALVLAVIEVESGYNPQALSPKGARGLMQLLPATARRYGMRDARELYDPVRNVDWGTRHIKDLLAQHDGQWALAMAAYNAGAGAVARHGQRIPAYAETMLYVPAVLARAARFAEDMGGEGAVTEKRE